MSQNWELYNKNIEENIGVLYNYKDENLKVKTIKPNPGMRLSKDSTLLIVTSL